MELEKQKKNFAIYYSISSSSSKRRLIDDDWSSALYLPN